MGYKQIHDEYRSAVDDFVKKLNDIDEKHGTYLKCTITDVPRLQVGSCLNHYHRTIEIDEIVLISDAVIT